MEIKILAQITSDGFIARRDGKRDWYLAPNIYGISVFFATAAATLDYQEGRCQVILRSGECSFCDEPELFLKQWNSSSEYVAIEAAPHTLPLVHSLISCGLVSELHLIGIPILLTEGIYSPVLFEIESTWTLVEERLMGQSREISYRIFRHPENEKEETT